MVKILIDEFLRRLKENLARSAPEGLRIVDEDLFKNADDGDSCKLGESANKRLEAYFYTGPYLGKTTVWVGFGARSEKAIVDLTSQYDAATVGTLRNGDWNPDLTLNDAARREVRNHRFVYEDLRGSGYWKWFGVYLTPERANVGHAVGILVELAGSLAAIAPRARPPWIGPTDRYALRKVRLAQAFFRDRQLERWNGRCCVTGCDVEPVLRASHIDGWAKSKDIEHRTGEDNGLLLVSTLDALFDRKLVSFDDHGRMQISKEIEGRTVPGVGDGMSICGGLFAEQRKYMRRHKKAFEQKQAAYRRANGRRTIK
jgi:hypothetical protein